LPAEDQAQHQRSVRRALPGFGEGGLAPRRPPTKVDGDISPSTAAALFNVTRLLAVVHNIENHLSESTEVLATVHATVDVPSNCEHNRYYNGAFHFEPLPSVVAGIFKTPSRGSPRAGTLADQVAEGGSRRRGEWVTPASALLAAVQ
jgi:hypothetical protein